MADHISQADVMSQAIILELKARVREQEKQLREEEKETERLRRLANSRYRDIHTIFIALIAIVIGAGLTLGMLAAAGWWSP